MSASTSASPPKRGRPNFEAETKRIKLRPDVFVRWLVKKTRLDLHIICKDSHASSYHWLCWTCSYNCKTKIETNAQQVRHGGI